MKNLYYYNGENGELFCVQQYDGGTIPEYTTFKVPPKTKENEVAVFDVEKDAWEVYKDYRFTHRMLKDNEVFVIEDIGEIPSGYRLITIAEAEQIEEQIRIDKLTMTALDFIGVLVSFGLTLEQIDAYLNENISVRMQLQFCQNVYCGVAKSLMPIEFDDITITAEMVENAFRAKHGEV